MDIYKRCFETFPKEYEEQGTTREDVENNDECYEDLLSYIYSLKPNEEVNILDKDLIYNLNYICKKGIGTSEEAIQWAKTYDNIRERVNVQTLQNNINNLYSVMQKLKE